MFWALPLLLHLQLMCVFEGKASQRLGDSFGFVGLSFFGLDSNLALTMPARRLSTKAMVLTVTLFGFFSMAIWNAGLTSTLTVERYTLAIQSLEDLLRYSNSFNLILIRRSSDEEYFAKADEKTDKTAKSEKSF